MIYIPKTIKWQQIQRLIIKLIIKNIGEVKRLLRKGLNRIRQENFQVLKNETQEKLTIKNLLVKVERLLKRM
jgi:hypothetical protein